MADEAQVKQPSQPADPQGQGKDLEPAKMADILMAKYVSLRAEIGLHLGFYKAHVRNFQLFTGALLAAFAILASKDGASFLYATSWYVWCACLFVLSIAADYLILDVIDPQYALANIGDRLALIEEQLNGLAQRRLLIWESGAASRAFSGIKPYEGVLNPHILITICGLFVFLVASLVVPCYGYWQIWLNNCTLTAAWCSKTYAMPTALFIAAGLNVAMSTVSLYSIYTVLTRMKGEPKKFFEKLLNDPYVMPGSRKP